MCEHRPVTASHALAPDLFAEQLISSYADDPCFTERPWLTDEIEHGLATAEGAVVLLLAEPGSGKTAVMSQLARAHPGWLRFFLRGDSKRPYGSADARTFFLTLGHQLATLEPGLYGSRQLEVAVDQIVERVEPGGRVVGISVDDLRVSPFLRTALEIRQQVTSVGGELAGLSVRSMTVEERLLDVANLQHLALLAPATALLERNPSDALVVLVDALDEAGWRRTSDDQTVVDWLIAAPELPGNLRFVLASRPDREIVSALRGRFGNGLTIVSLDDAIERARADVFRFASSLSSRDPVKPMLLERGIEPDTFAETIAHKGETNFQYVAALFAALSSALERDDNDAVSSLMGLQDLPDDLSDLYAFLLNRIRLVVADVRIETSGPDLYAAPVFLPAWQGLYLPILGVLAVAGEALTRKQMASFVGLDAGSVWLGQALADLAPLLRRTEAKFSLYHSTIGEFLASSSTREAHDQLFVDGRAARRMIVSFYRGQAPAWAAVEWTAVDDYGVVALPRHLQWLARHDKRFPYADELDQLLCPPLLRESRRRFGSHRSFAQSVQLSLELARDDELSDPPTVVRELRSRYLLALLESLALAVPTRILKALAEVGDVDQAIALADLDPDLTARARRYLGIAEALATVDRERAIATINHALALETGAVVLDDDIPLLDRLDRAAQIAPALAGKLDELRGTLSQDAPPAEPSITDRASEILARLEQPQPADGDLVAAAYAAVLAAEGWDATDMLPPLAKLLEAAEDRDRLSELVAAAMRLEDDGYGGLYEGWGALAEACGSLGLVAGLDRILASSSRLSDNTHRARALQGLAFGCALGGHVDGIESVFAQTAELNPAFVNPMQVLVRLIDGASAAGDGELLRGLALRVLAQIESDPEDAEPRVRLAREVAEALVAVQQPEAAAATVKGVVPLVASFAEMAGEVGHFSFAGVHGDRARAYADLSELLGRVGEREEAERVGYQAMNAAAQVISKFPTLLTCGRKVISGLIAGGATAAALEIIDRVEQAFGYEYRWAGPLSAHLRAEAANRLHKAGHASLAAEQLELAAEELGLTDNEDLAVDIGVSLYGIGRREEGLAMILNLENTASRAFALQALARTHDGGEAADLCRRSLERLDAVDRHVDGVDLRAAAALIFAQLGLELEAGDCLALALAAIPDLDREYQARPLGCCASTAALIGDDEALERCVERAAAAFESGDDRPLHAVAVQLTGISDLASLQRLLSAYPSGPFVLCPSILAMIRGRASLGDISGALDLLRRLLDENLSLDNFTYAVEAGAHAVAALDGGDSLVRLYEAMSDLRHDWSVD
jgi:hypothetical protein